MLRQSVLVRNKIIPISRRCLSVTRYHCKSQPSPRKGDYDFIREEIRTEADIARKLIPDKLVQDSDRFDIEEEDEDGDLSPYRNADGGWRHGDNATEARLNEKTLAGKMDHSIAKLPREIAKTIQNNILVTTIPAKLREQVASLYEDLQQIQIQQSPSSPLECNTHIAALFLQDFSHVKQAILELQKRVGKEQFNPQRVLDVGYGPATGIVALNDVMGDEWVPREKDAYIVGRRNNEMKKRAKIILSRQLNENFSNEGDKDKDKEEGKVVGEVVENDDPVNEYLGPIDTKRINIRTRLKDALPVTKKYDLIIVHHSLLSKEYNFPGDVDQNLRMVLQLLAPGGHLILVERGNALGSEIITRARQVMIRPEKFPSELGKIPRPYIKGSSGKPQRLKKEGALISDADIDFEREMLAQLDAEEAREMGVSLEEEINAKHGQVDESDLKFEEEDSDEYDVFHVDTPVEDMHGKIDYHLKIVAPCPHHRKCPLQLGDPKYFKIPSHKHRLDFCSFSKVVERPEYTMELKKGKTLAAKWDKSAIDGKGSLSRGELKKLQGSGRPGGRNTEDGSFAYLIAERSLDDAETIAQIDNLRQHSNHDNSPVDSEAIETWPRIVTQPGKLKKNVKLTVCSSEGDIETWQIPKSFGKEAYHDARKAQLGDLWALGKKSSVKRQTISDKTKEKLEALYKTQKKTFLKEQKKKIWKRKTGVSSEEFDDGFLATEIMAAQLESKPKYRKQGKRLDIDPESYEGL
ncbi:uncharacterized protein LODBEIA_P26820 [Lodderomyces beijingensis]|uniref:Uncharacterized protein n=1 Tax=Lodderomyces beijingensis TaxID=1775926 RepID=A0ABP0ZJY2_9ASCO